MSQYLKVYYSYADVWEVIDERSDIGIFQGSLEECDSFLKEVLA